MSYSIHLVTALPAEARPVASRFGLARVQPDLGFPVYRREPYTLVVTGPGKINAAAATAFLGALGHRWGSSQDGIWVNLGIAGHAERSVGELLLAGSIQDAGSGRVWHPILPEDPPCPVDDLLTLDRPDFGHHDQEGIGRVTSGMVEMEASGFYPTACRFSPVANVQVLKVISDNRDPAARSLSAQRVYRLVDEALDRLEVLLGHLPGR